MELNHIARRAGRLSGFLKGELRLSNGLMNRLKWSNAILVNGKPARTNAQVEPGDRITVILDDPSRNIRQKICRCLFVMRTATFWLWINRPGC